jgi:hypothetical protein
MARTDHHAPADVQARPHLRRTTGRHSLGVSLANRAAGAHRYRDEVSAEGGKTALRRRVRRTNRQAWRTEAATEPLGN